MKKLLLSVLTLSLCVSGYAQNRQIVKNIKDLKPLPNSHFVPAMNMGISGDELPLKKNFNSQLAPHQAAKVTVTGQTIGNTTYDLQSNGASIASRFYNSGNELGTGWTFSSDVAGTYPDRGTGVVRSHDNGATWDAFSNARIESKRTGFGSIDRIGTGEVVISHAAGAPLTLFSHATTSAPWDSSMIPYPAGMGYPLWNSMKVGGNNGTTIHMVTATAPVAQTPPGALFNGMDGAMVYYRSLDGGVTWDQQAIQLPESDISPASPYLNFRANSYAIDAKGDNVAVVSGSVAADWSLWKSTDNGTTWTRTPIMAFPKPKFDQVTMDTDTNADGIGDTLICSDGAVSVVIDNNGIAHCFTGAMTVLEEPGAGQLGLFLTTNGLLYWNENMGSNPPVVIAQADETLGFAANLEPRYGNDGLCSMPSAGVDAYNNIYVAYSSLNDGTDDGANGWSYHSIWAQASMDGGNTWLTPFAVYNDDFTEEVYPSVARDVDAPGCFHLMYQSDGAPGTTVPPNGVGTIGPNDIVYACIDPINDLNVFVGISQNSSPSFDISISPNPASESAMLKYTLDKAASVKINIADVLGQNVYSSEVMMVKGANNISINLKNFDSGIYFVNSTIDGKIYTDKLSVK